jgi:hypothetical protein
MTNIIDHLEMTGDIDSAVQAAFHHLESLQAEAARLQLLDPANATPCYHKDKHGQPRYLWLIYPQRNGERIREYVGSKPDKITAALTRVQAHEDLTKARRQAADIKARLALVTKLLGKALQVAQEKDV